MIYKFLSIVDTSTLPDVSPDKDSADNMLNIVFAISGAIAVLIVTIAGFKYVMSMGHPDATKKAKDAILNALIGLAVVIFANVIIRFVVTRL